MIVVAFSGFSGFSCARVKGVDRGRGGSLFRVSFAWAVFLGFFFMLFGTGLMLVSYWMA